MANILYILLALVGLNFLVFIHEFAHYIVARREGMRVEVFSIGFGKPLVSWTRKGVKWQIALFLVGGYVRIAGMEKDGNLEPHEIPDGFYSKNPWARIKVALAGPLANLIFTLLLFGAIWTSGGREKPFWMFTKLIGYVDPNSELYKNGVRPGDEITGYNGEPFSGYKDLVYAAIMNGHPANVEGNKLDYFTKEKTPYEYTLTPYESPLIKRGLKTVGILAPAMHLIYKGSIHADAPLEGSGVEINDRIVWVNGELVFSEEHLSHLLNNDKVLLTIERDGKRLLKRVFKVPLKDLRLTSEEAGELSDWKYDANLRAKGDSPLFIPYVLSHDLHVQNSLSYVNSDFQVAHTSPSRNHSSLDAPLGRGDRILSVDGVPVDSGAMLLKELQTPRAQIIVKRDSSQGVVSWQEEDYLFTSAIDWKALLPIVQTIGTSNTLHSNENFHLLHPVTPRPFKNFSLSEAQRVEMDRQIKKREKEANKIIDPEEREEAFEQIKRLQNRLMLGVTLQDRSVIYNPNAFVLFGSVFQEVSRTLIGFFSGYFSPKYFGGPIFILQTMQQSWGVGIKEALFWLGVISLNLGVINLLPVPVLDGGHICFSLLEKIRKKPLKAKTMQRLVIPFVALLIFLFIYLTYNDLTRIFGRIFPF